MLTLERSVMTYLAIGLVQGLLLWLATSMGDPGAWYGLITAVLVGGVNLLLLGENIRHRGTAWLVVGLTVVMTAISAWVFWDGDEYWRPGSWLAGSWSFFAVVITYICTVFILSWPTREGRYPRYEDLFRHAWGTVFIVLLGLLLNAVFWALLWLWGGLFKMLGIVALNKLFSTEGFICISSAMVFALGVHMGREKERVIGLLRGIVLTLCRFLLPLSALIVIVFTFALPFTGLEPIWDTGYSTPIMLWLVAVNLFLLNGVFQDGTQGSGYPTWLVRVVDLCLLCLPVLVVLAGYSTWLRIEQYGLTPSRILAMVLVLVIFIHSVAALLAVFVSRSIWLGSLRVSNPVIALLCVVLLLAMHTPWFSPLKMSANNQVQRLLSGRTAVDNFDADTLRNRLGSEGKQAYDALLEQVEQGLVLAEPGRQVLLKRLKEVSAGNGPTGSERLLEWIGPKVEGSEQFYDKRFNGQLCLAPGCALWAVDLDQDGQPEVLQLPKNKWSEPLYFFKRDAQGNWQRVGTYAGGGESSLELIEKIRQGKVKVVTPRYQSLQIDGVELSPTLDKK
ncbi:MULTISPECIES: DUF4153 domain-containing protein [Pseudomonas]|uniref:DUF4153 domain-containing protein n=1 Tax=Pseudomonas TaxID=286 RepID=UPI0003571AA8|nr:MULTISPECIES: DUF4153 domain-containing protein [Pseudomonas]EPJ92001.1 hypothetical protein CF149_18581 [Pseudomonas psychrophila]MDY7583191.1 DUF4153 domain-containing protein [Pseudomonas sp. CCI3.1]MEB0066578.1 DUF4153 domain-containing protein [Pseudomonas sp. CCI3.1]MEB0072355.1 DUF4153 domain-containing protein [Pseudomonas sp. CCI1.4]